MTKKVLIVEDQFIEANDLQLMLRKAGYVVCGIARSVPIAQEMISRERPDLVLLDIYLKGKLTGIDLAHQLKKDNIAFIYLSANSNQETLTAAKTTEPYGFIVKPFRERDLLVTLEIAQYRHEHSRETRSMRANELLSQLQKISIINSIDWHERLLRIGKILQQEIPFDYIAMGFQGSEEVLGLARSFLRISFDEYQALGLEELAIIKKVSFKDLRKWFIDSTAGSGSAIVTGQEFERLERDNRLIEIARSCFQMKSMLSFPVQLTVHGKFWFNLFSRRTDAFNVDHLQLFQGWEEALRMNVQKIPADKVMSKDLGEKPETVLNKIKNPNESLPGFSGIIGSSHLLLNVFDNVAQVAPFDTTILLLGESGTGKERIAESIHQLSPRSTRPLVKINCAALPASLIESELFGHVKGSFTGATDKRVGKFEQANGGTIFLDEIGEMTIDLQVKLLRVLQEQEIEPIGGNAPMRIDVRVIAATNRNLEKEVAEGRFRLDLYYRLNVFPILMPSLRERREDIPLLTNHFIAVYNRKAAKNVNGVSERVLTMMKEYSWPGNIRELENLIQRAVLLAKGPVIEELSFPTLHKRELFTDSAATRVNTIHENERDYIRSILRKCNGRVWGKGGAAELLNIPPTTLKSKMKKLGIEKED